ncbi:MAG: hypothetical protein ACI91B_004260, partial [Planctomycetota bacterium]
MQVSENETCIKRTRWQGSCPFTHSGYRARVRKPGTPSLASCGITPADLNHN